MKYFFKMVIIILLIIPLWACNSNQGEHLILKANNEWIKDRNHSAVEMFSGE